MKIITAPDFLSILENQHLLLDTNVFVDSLLYPGEFERLFNKLKEYNATLVTIDLVLIEFLRGASEERKFDEKKEIVDKIIETYLPLTKNVFEKLRRLVYFYKEDGKGVSITDMALGAMLMQYPKNLFLMTKNTNDFPTNIFSLNTYVNLMHRKAIQSYGVYSFEQNKKSDIKKEEVEIPF